MIDDLREEADHSIGSAAASSDAFIRRLSCIKALAQVETMRVTGAILPPEHAAALKEVRAVGGEHFDFLAEQPNG